MYTMGKNCHLTKQRRKRGHNDISYYTMKGRLNGRAQDNIKETGYQGVIRGSLEGGRVGMESDESNHNEQVRNEMKN